MKRLLKLLSIFGVLIILGSCGASSKTVNVSTVTGTQKYVQFINYTDNVYKVLAVYVNDKAVGVGEPYAIQSGATYTIRWQWIEDKAIRSHEVSYSFTSTNATCIITLGTGLSTNNGYENIFYETYLN